MQDTNWTPKMGDRVRFENEGTGDMRTGAIVAAMCEIDPANGFRMNTRYIVVDDETKQDRALSRGQLQQA